jgi:hypothetical protein
MLVCEFLKQVENDKWKSKVLYSESEISECESFKETQTGGQNEKSK